MAVQKAQLILGLNKEGGPKVVNNMGDYQMAKNKIVKRKTIEEKRNFWSKIKYWQRGGVIGMILGIFFQILVFFLRKYNFNVGNVYDFAFIHFIPAIIFSYSNFMEKVSILIWYSFLGIVLGYIFQILKNKLSKKFVLPIFILVIFVLLVILFLIESKILGIMYGGFV